MYQAILKKMEVEATSANKFAAFMKLTMTVGGLTIGMMLMLSALLVWATSAIENQNHDRLELILIIAGFIFLGIGSHGLDLLHSAKREAAKRRLNL